MLHSFPPLLVLLPALLLLLLQAYLADQVVPLFGNTHTTTSITGAQTTCFRHEARQIIAQAVNAKVWTPVGAVRATDGITGVQEFFLSRFISKTGRDLMPEWVCAI